MNDCLVIIDCNYQIGQVSPFWLFKYVRALGLIFLSLYYKAYWQDSEKWLILVLFTTEVAIFCLYFVVISLLL